MQKSIPNHRFLARLSEEEHRKLSIPATICALIIISYIIFGSYQLPHNEVDRILGIRLGFGGLYYIFILYVILLPLAHKYPLLYWPVTVINALGAASLSVIAGANEITLLATVMISVVIVTATLAGRWPTYLFVGLTAFFTFIFATPQLVQNPEQGVRFLSLFMTGIMITETIELLGNYVSSQMMRLEAINRVAREISATIDTPVVLSSVCNAVKESFQADTYYVALREGEMMRFELVYDDGRFYPKVTSRLGTGLSAWVMNNQKSLLIRDMAKESPKLGIKPVIFGSSKESKSWMGTTMEAGGRVIGMMAVASYKKNAFKKGDLSMLESLAQQAALAIDNAANHAQVLEQSRLDSLTGVYNHGYFLVYLNEFTQFSKETGKTNSLVMLDIDYFKDYNDRYGHQVGDKVLRLVVEAIRENIRSTDIIGRWGGEEFAILLLEANGPQTSMIAGRIRDSLARLEITSHSGEKVPAPTVSQGIAVFPSESRDVESLVHLADQRLYVAKERGRNQIEPAMKFWPETPPAPPAQDKEESFLEG